MGSSRTKLLLGARETFGELLGLIDAAQSRLWVSVAFFVPDFRFDVGGGTEPLSRVTRISRIRRPRELRIYVRLR